jgi:hypothetical protein
MGASSPAMMRAASPGISRNAKKTSVMTKNKMGIPMRIRPKM